MKQDSQETLSAKARSRAVGLEAAYKTLLVPIDAGESSRRSVEVACELAGRFDAHVVGLYVRPSYYIAPELAAFGSTVPIALIQDAMREAARTARAVFDRASAGRDLSVEWRTTTGNATAVVTTHARCADLVIVNQRNPDEDESQFDNSLMLTIGRPVLLVPHVGNVRHIGDRVLVCWNASHEAARAVTDALPLLKRASQVTVMTIDAKASETGHGEEPGSDIALFLARHGVPVATMQTASGGLDAGEVILSRAADEASDLIVMGAYGHTRMRETISGGATRTILRSMTVPVLMSH